MDGLNVISIDIVNVGSIIRGGILHTKTRTSIVFCTSSSVQIEKVKSYSVLHTNELTKRPHGTCARHLYLEPGKQSVHFSSDLCLLWKR